MSNSPDGFSFQDRRQFSRAVVVDTSVTNHQFANPMASIYVGVAGDIVVDMGDMGTQITFKAVPIGILPIFVTKVYKVGTAATNLVALT